MTDLGDRILVLVMAGIGLGGLFGWAFGFVEAQVPGAAQYVLWVSLLLLFLAIMYGIWREFEVLN